MQPQLDATSAGCNPTAPLGGIECATRVPLGGVEWHEILRQLGILQSLRHSVASSARRARHSVASSGALERMLARPGNVDTAGPQHSGTRAPASPDWPENPWPGGPPPYETLSQPGNERTHAASTCSSDPRVQASADARAWGTTGTPTSRVPFVGLSSFAAACGGT